METCERMQNHLLNEIESELPTGLSNIPERPLDFFIETANRI
jgi:hypothetical protein